MSILYLNHEGKIRAVDTSASGIVYKNADQIIVKSNGIINTYTYTSFDNEINLNPGKYIIHGTIKAINTDLCFLDHFNNIEEVFQQPYLIQTLIHLSDPTDLIDVDTTILLDTANPLIKFSFCRYIEVDEACKMVTNTNYNGLSNVCIDMIVESVFVA